MRGAGVDDPEAFVRGSDMKMHKKGLVKRTMEGSRESDVAAIPRNC